MKLERMEVQMEKKELKKLSEIETILLILLNWVLFLPKNKYKKI